MAFISSTSIPPEIVAAVARFAHKRGCGSFNGVRAVRPEAFEGHHRSRDLVLASINVADLCNALQLSPDDLLDAARRNARAS